MPSAAAVGEAFAAPAAVAETAVADFAGAGGAAVAAVVAAAGQVVVEVGPWVVVL